MLGAYALIYSVSSEVIHGSPFGVNFFHQAHSEPHVTTENFRAATAEQVNDLMLNVAHAAAGYLNVFFRSQKMSGPYLAEQKLFNRLLAFEGAGQQEIEHLN